jgi:hypothetical protein
VREFDQQSETFNKSAANASTAQIFLNLVRFSGDEPTEWIHPRQIQETKTIGGELGIAANPVSTLGLSPITILPKGTLSTQPQLSVDLLDAREFYQQYIKELPLDLVARYLHGEINAYMYYVLLKRVEISYHETFGPDHWYAVENNPGYPGPTNTDRVKFRNTYMTFENMIFAIFDAGLTVEPILKETRIGPWVDASQAKDELKDYITASGKDSSATFGFRLADASLIKKADKSLVESKITGMRKPHGLNTIETNITIDTGPKEEKQTQASKDSYTGGAAARCATADVNPELCAFQLIERSNVVRICLRSENLEKKVSKDNIFDSMPERISENNKILLENKDLLIFIKGLRCGATAADRESANQIARRLARDRDTAANVEGSGDLDLSLIDYCSGSAASMIDQAVSDDDAAFLYRYCTLVGRLKQLTGASPGADQKVIFVKMMINSTSEIVNLLGEAVGFSEICEGKPIQDQCEISVPEYSSLDRRAEDLKKGVYYCGFGIDARDELGGPVKGLDLCRRLIVARKWKHTPEKPWVSINYDGYFHWIPERGKGASSDVIELLHQIIAYDTVAKDFPAGNFLTVTPIP